MKKGALSDEDRARIKKQEELFSEYQHYQEQLVITRILVHDLDRKLIEIKAQILEAQ